MHFRATEIREARAKLCKRYGTILGMEARVSRTQFCKPRVDSEVRRAGERDSCAVAKLSGGSQNLN